MQIRLLIAVSIFGAFSVALSFNHQLIDNLLAYSESDSISNNNKNMQSITYYSLFSDLSRDFTSTLDKFKHSNSPHESSKTTNNDDTTTAK